MSTENAKQNLTILKEKLKAAAYDYAEAYALELDQEPVSGVQPSPELSDGLDLSIKDAVNDGALDALMSARSVRGNQSAAAIILKINRATLRTRLFRSGLLLQRRKLSEAEQQMRDERNGEPCEATRTGKLAPRKAA